MYLPTTNGASQNNKSLNENQIAGFKSISIFAKNGLQNILESTKALNALPSGLIRDSYCAYPTFGKIIDIQSYNILKILTKVLKNQNIKGNIERRQQDEQLEMVLECNDLMLERINSNLDELTGIKKIPQTILIESKIMGFPHSLGSCGSWNYKKDVTNDTARLLTAKNILRPQVNFTIPIDNSAKNLFEPKINYKPNSLKPLSLLPEYDEYGNIESYLHPYGFELRKFEPSAEQLEYNESIVPPKLINLTQLIYIENKDKLLESLDELKHVPEIAVDLEHHSYRSFQGFTCLMQLSSKDKDYIIDALKLREEMHVLNEVFTNPKITKVFHGADSDIEWLQRDLSIYVVNMFDTHQAAKLLGLPRLSLAYLLKHYCNINADKTFQLADWRIRPLPKKLIMYAQQDTHFLIYIYKMLLNELHTKGNKSNLLKTVYERSREICEKRYIKPKIHENSHIDLYRKSKRSFDNRQIFALKEIFAWRDAIARKEDESYCYVIPNHMMLQIAESLPREMQGILACCNPIPPLIRQNLHVLHQIILKAREQPLIKPINNEHIVRVLPQSSANFNSKLYSQYDSSHDSEFRDDLQTLLKQNIENNFVTSNVHSVKPIIRIFEIDLKYQKRKINEKLEELNRKKFVSPYERYTAIIQFLDNHKNKEELSNQQNKETLKTVQQQPKLESAKNDSNINLHSFPLKKSLKRKIDENKCILLESKINKDTSENSVTFNKKLIEQPQFIQHAIDLNLETGSSLVTTNIEKNNLPVNYDYKMVDFKKYKGSVEKAKNLEIKTKFHGKVKNDKKSNKKFNKLFTFETNKK